MSKKGYPPFEGLRPVQDIQARTVDLRTIKGRSDKIVRMISPPEDFEAEMKAVANSKRYYDEMRETYGIPVVDIDVVAGKHERGGKTLYVIVDRIQGKNLYEVERLTPALQAELAKLFANLARYYSAMFEQKRPYWFDIQPHQFVYGHKVNEKENHAYLVDVDAAFTDRFYSEDEEDNLTIESVVDSLWSIINEYEKKFEPPIRFTEARDIIRVLIDKIAEEEPVYEK